MNCLCALTNPIPQCVDAIQIGVIADHNADIIVIITETVTGRNIRLEATSDGSGVVTADTSDNEEFFSPNLLYEIRLVHLNEQPIEFTVDTTLLPCVQAPFIPGDSTLSILTLA